MTALATRYNALALVTNKLAARFDLGHNGAELIETLKATAFKGQVTDAQMTALMVVANHIVIDDSGCWLWTGATSRGYGELTYQGKNQRAHRFVFERLVENINDGLWVLHHCDNKLCVNPIHLYQGTPIDNRSDMLERERWSHPWAKRTSCTKGHEYGSNGFYVAKDGSRVCKTCDMLRQRVNRLAKKGATI